MLTDQTDIAVPTVAYISEKNLDLKGLELKQQIVFTNKYLMREYASKVGIPIPEYRLCHTVNEAIQFLDHYSIAIIKPIDSQSSRGIHIVRSKRDIEKNIIKIAFNILMLKRQS